MTVYFYIHPEACQDPGGGKVQLMKTKEYLEKQGLEILLYDQWNHRFKPGDILHVFGSLKQSYSLMKIAKDAGAKLVLSSICWYDFPSALCTYPDFGRRTLDTLRYLAKVFFPWVPSGRKRVMHLADLLLPNSQAEANQLVRYFGVKPQRIVAIPNGVDLKYASPDPRPFIDRYHLRDFFLCVGRIEPRKNQLALIRAHRGLEKPLVIIGEPVSSYPDYAKKCREEAGPNVHFLGALPHDSELLRSAYAACNTFVLPSWFETPGLAALEAGLAGAKVLITQGGSTREYFGDYVFYANPLCISDIRAKMKEVSNAPSNGKLSEHIRTHYLWDRVAEKTFSAYQSLL